MNGNVLIYYPGNRNTDELTITRSTILPVRLLISEWSDKLRKWEINTSGVFTFTVKNLKPDSEYKLSIDGTEKGIYRSDIKGLISFEYNCQSPAIFSLSE
jgi:hypothetical protein